MKEPIIVVSSDERQLAGLARTLETQGYRPVLSRSERSLEDLIREHSSLVIIWDLDRVPADNSFMKEIKQRNPGVHIVVISARPFHPELKEAMVSHIDVCLSKPPDRDELLFWLRSIFRDRPETLTGSEKETETRRVMSNRNSNRYTQGEEEMPE